jgi:hypothetical protein
MARRNNEQEPSSDKGKIRFVFAEVEGNNQSLQDLIRAMMSAMSQPAQPTLPSRGGVALPHSPPPHGTVGKSQLVDVEIARNEEVADSVSEDVSSGNT